MLASILEIEPDVENGDAVGDPSDRDQIDAGSGDLRRRGRRDAAGRLGDRAAGHHRDGLGEHIGSHIVEQHSIDTLVERLP